MNQNRRREEDCKCSFTAGSHAHSPGLHRSLSGALRSAADSAQEQRPRLRPLQAVGAVPGEGLALIERDFAHVSPMFLRTSVNWEGNGNPLQYSWLKNPIDRGAWWAAVNGVARVRHDWVTNFNFHFLSHIPQNICDLGKPQTRVKPPSLSILSI